MNEPLRAAVIDRPYGVPVESSVSAVSSAAIIAGAFVAAALSLILIVLGSGLGLLSVSPWDYAGASGKVIGFGTAIWLGLMQLISASMGGYLAGRLRTKWVDARTDEIFFRDTAHGFLVWAVGLVITAAFLTSAATSLVSGGARVAAAGLAAAGGSAAATAPIAGATSLTDPSLYLVDRLLRPSQPASGAAARSVGSPEAPGAMATNAGGAAPASEILPASDARVRAELGRIVAASLRSGEIRPEDRTYLAQIVASRTALSQADAERRVDDAVAQSKAIANEARAAADEARKAAAYFSLWLFVSLLIGAFCASCFATVGGRRRDRLTA